MVNRKKDVITPEEAITLPGLFVERVKRSPMETAYIQYDKDSSKWVESTWNDMAQQVARWQEAFIKDGLKPGDKIAVMLKNCKEWVIFDMAAQGLGLVVVPLYATDSPANAAYILRDSEAKVLLIEGAEQWERIRDDVKVIKTIWRVLTLDRVDKVDDYRVSQLDGWLLESESGMKLRPAKSTDLATIVYTSGTTGKPKGVMLSHKNILSNCHASLKAVSIYTDDLLLSFLPLSHTFERTAGYYLPIMSGASVAYARSIPLLSEDLTIIKPTVFIAVPRIFERVYAKIMSQLESKSKVASALFKLAIFVGEKSFEYGQRRAAWTPILLLWPLLRMLVGNKVMAKLGGRVRLAVSGGAALAPAVSRLFISLGLPILQGYGLTETSPVIAVNHLEDNDPATVGKVLDKVEVRLGDGDELQVRGPGIMKGYWNDEGATAKMFTSDGWLKTGDVANLDGGKVQITGRIKEIIVLSTGEKAPPADMEIAITMDPMLEKALVMGEGKSYLAAVVVLEHEAWRRWASAQGLDPFAESALLDERVEGMIMKRVDTALREFPEYAKVKKVFMTLDDWTVEDGLMTPTLKLKREKIQNLYSEQIDRMYQQSRAA